MTKNKKKKLKKKIKKQQNLLELQRQQLEELDKGSIAEEDGDDEKSKQERNMDESGGDADCQSLQDRSAHINNLKRPLAEENVNENAESGCDHIHSNHVGDTCNQNGTFISSNIFLIVFYFAVYYCLHLLQF